MMGETTDVKNKIRMKTDDWKLKQLSNNIGKQGWEKAVNNKVTYFDMSQPE